MLMPAALSSERTHNILQHTYVFYCVKIVMFNVMLQNSSRLWLTQQIFFLLRGTVSYYNLSLGQYQISKNLMPRLCQSIVIKICKPLWCVSWFRPSQISKSNISLVELSSPHTLVFVFSPSYFSKQVYTHHTTWCNILFLLYCPTHLM